LKTAHPLRSVVPCQRMLGDLASTFVSFALVAHPTMNKDTLLVANDIMHPFQIKNEGEMWWDVC
jgi:hypothetical protein